jgi:glycopeptide antibiotics resistance protein
LLFVPLGLLIPLVFPGLKKRGWGKVLLASFGISLMVEVLQLFHETRAFDINDLMFNTLGGLAGYAIYMLLRTLFNR